MSVRCIVRPGLILLAAGVFCTSAFGQKAAAGSFNAFLDRMDAAQRELQNGNVAPYKELWSRSDDVTLSGGFGGTIEKGWTNVGSRLDWVARQFSKGSNRIDRLVTATSGSLGYVVQTEHIEFIVPDNNAMSVKDYRVTMVFRKEHGAWKIVHRQADSNLTKAAPR